MEDSGDTKKNTNKTDLNFYGSDPGAVKHGNFINYYTFHDVKERIKNLHPIMFSMPINNRLVCLDIGCNSGELTNALYEYLKTINPDCDIHMLGVDIDSTLIKRAEESNSNPNISFATCNIMAQNECSVIYDFLKRFDSKIFDVSFCFSVTMWIHLNNGDDGLLKFLHFIKFISRTLIIEPQPWKCYRNAQRRIRKSGHSFEHYRSLKIKSGLGKFIENTLTEGPYIKLHESQPSAWDRKIISFQLFREEE